MTPDDSAQSDRRPASAVAKSPARRRFIRCMAAAAGTSIATGRAAQEIDVPDDWRTLPASPPPPWAAKEATLPASATQAPWPEPVVQVNTEGDIAHAVARINTAGQGTLAWGPGHFRIPKVTDAHTSLYFANLSHFRMHGQGPERTILSHGAEEATVDKQLRLCAFENIRQLDIAELALDGERQRYHVENTPESGENSFWQAQEASAYQLHNNREAMNNLFLRNIHAGSLRGLHSTSARGDFLNLANVQNLLIDDCDIADCGRNGITLGGQRGLEWSRNIEISRCRFRGNIDTQMIDLELHGRELATPAQFNRNVYIHDCLFEAHQIDDSIDRDQFAMVLYAVFDFRVERCEIHGPVMVRNGHGSFSDNTGGITQFTMDRFSQADIQRTRFELQPRLRGGNDNLAGILVVRRDALSPVAFSLRDCEVSTHGLTPDVLIADCESVLISNNRFSGDEEACTVLLAARQSNMKARLLDNSGLEPAQLREVDGYTVELISS